MANVIKTLASLTPPLLFLNNGASLLLFMVNSEWHMESFSYDKHFLQCWSHKSKEYSRANDVKLKVFINQSIQNSKIPERITV